MSNIMDWAALARQQNPTLSAIPQASSTAMQQSPVWQGNQFMPQGLGGLLQGQAPGLQMGQAPPQQGFPLTINNAPPGGGGNWMFGGEGGSGGAGFSKGGGGLAQGGAGGGIQSLPLHYFLR